MALADIIVLAIIALSLLVGLWRGLVKEALSLACWIAAVVLALMFNDEVAVYLDAWIASAGLQRIVAFVMIFVVTVFAGGLVSTVISKLTSAVGLQAADRALGGLFGLLRGLVIVTLAVMLTASFETFRPWYAESRTAPYLLDLAEQFRSLLEDRDLLPRGNTEEPAEAGAEAEAGTAPANEEANLTTDGALTDLAQSVMAYPERGNIACVA